jgi:hypothetical protein
VEIILVQTTLQNIHCNVHCVGGITLFKLHALHLTDHSHISFKLELCQLNCSVSSADCSLYTKLAHYCLQFGLLGTLFDVTSMHLIMTTLSEV